MHGEPAVACADEDLGGAQSLADGLSVGIRDTQPYASALCRFGGGLVA